MNLIKQYLLMSFICIVSFQTFSQIKDIKTTEVYVTWGDVDVRYTPQTYIDQKMKLNWKTKAWKGERVHQQILIKPNGISKNVKAIVTSLSDTKGNVIDLNNTHLSYQEAVWTDHLTKDNMGCGLPAILSDRDSSLVMDRITLDNEKYLSLDSTYSLWLSVDVPHDLKEGKYNGIITISDDHKDLKKLTFSIEVSKRMLPKQVSYHLDLWQNPYSVARYYNVNPWSEEHFEVLKPTMKQLAKAGQKIITTTVLNKAWGEQTYDPYNTMVLRTKMLDGSWDFNFDIFDKWVEFMIEMGIDEQINCYSIAPWSESYQYFDLATNSHQYLKAKVGEESYNVYWREFLFAFATHLKKKGWFEKTTIAMDERPLDIMQSVIKLIKGVDANFKISLAGEYHAEIEPSIYDYCIGFYGNFPVEIIEKRKQEGKKTTFYTCCTEAIPNTFTFSPPAEGAYFAWNAIAKGYDGYLRWAFDNWNKNPMKDSRFSTFSAGDCFLVYPDSYSSIRFERMIEGIQDFEKIKILRREYAEDLAKSKLIDNVLAEFHNNENLYNKGAAVMINEARLKLQKIGF